MFIWGLFIWLATITLIFLKDNLLEEGISGYFGLIFLFRMVMFWRWNEIQQDFLQNINTDYTTTVYEWENIDGI